MKKLKVPLNEKIISLYYKDIIYKYSIYYIGTFLLIDIPLSLYVIISLNKLLVGLMAIISFIIIYFFLILILNSEKKLALKELEDSYKEYFINFKESEIVVEVGNEKYSYLKKYVRLSFLNHFYKLRFIKTKENYIIPKDYIEKEELIKLIRKWGTNYADTR